MRALATMALVARAMLAQSSPVYSASTIVNTAAGVTGSYAPNTFLTISGQNLAFTTRWLTPGDIVAHTLPTALTGTGMRVLIGNVPAYIYSVSPAAVMVLVPALLAPGPQNLQLEINGVAGPSIPLTLSATAPGLFTLPDGAHIMAAHGSSWALITADNPAQGGEWISIFASGLGAANPAYLAGEVPQDSRSIAAKSSFSVLVNGAALPAANVGFVGCIPGYAGFYQINLQLPSGLSPNPEIRVAIGNSMSPPQRYLYSQ